MASHIRRKPLVTYKSPSADDHIFVSLSLSSSTKTPTPISKARPPSRSNHVRKELVKVRTAGSRQYPMSPSLPLFHPFGRLAMSLPPLDPTKYGLPVPAVPDKIQESKSSSRLKRPASARSRQWRHARRRKGRVLGKDVGLVGSGKERMRMMVTPPTLRREQEYREALPVKTSKNFRKPQKGGQHVEKAASSVGIQALAKRPLFRGLPTRFPRPLLKRPQILWTWKAHGSWKSLVFSLEATKKREKKVN